LDRRYVWWDVQVEEYEPKNNKTGSDEIDIAGFASQNSNWKLCDARGRRSKADASCDT
jgi:hypothetical protein